MGRHQPVEDALTLRRQADALLALIEVIDVALHEPSSQLEHEQHQAGWCRGRSTS
jgi:hypothetical protein